MTAISPSQPTLPVDFTVSAEMSQKESIVWRDLPLVDIGQAS
jgi:hypothetical protein